MAGERESFPRLVKEVSAQKPQASVFVDSFLDGYWRNLQIITASATNLHDDSAFESALVELSQAQSAHMAIRPLEQDVNIPLYSYSVWYLPVICYSLIAMLVSLYSKPMVASRQPAVAMREASSGLTDRQRLQSYFWASTTCALDLWLGFILFGGFFYGWTTFQNKAALLMTLASFCDLIGITGMSFFVATVMQNKNMVTFVQTLLSLLIAFGSGIFVTRDFVHPVMQTIASIFSPIWLVKTAEIVVTVSEMTEDHQRTVGMHQFIMVLIGLAYYALRLGVFYYRSRYRDL